ncbi:zinc finger transcriptional activator [Conoideocrella luteorostrata]|uniref:Zinc finger transcriptional activator n=1 Tax=Conoideocrella luteorostrata TaxID=1105319 RepID=A0AAJ0FYA7_9HYPO|nr:zinc finger transcriptional activator [Conoideocrella luteorostrata]
MMLLIDWHMKSVNFPADFTDAEADLVDVDGRQASSVSNGLTAMGGRQRYGVSSVLEKLNLLSPAYRSNSMSRSLLSNAVSIAHERRCFELDAAHPFNPMSKSDNHKQEWKILVSVFIYLTDEMLATRLGLEPLLPEKSRRVVQDRMVASFTRTIPHCMLWESYFELSLEARKGRDILHTLKRSTLVIPTHDLVLEMENLSRSQD